MQAAVCMRVVLWNNASRVDQPSSPVPDFLQDDTLPKPYLLC